MIDESGIHPFCIPIGILHSISRGISAELLNPFENNNEAKKTVYIYIEKNTNNNKKVAINSNWLIPIN